MNILSKSTSIILSLIILLFVGNVQAQTNSDSTIVLTKAEKKAEKKRLNKEALKGRRFKINMVLTSANFDSEIRFTGPGGILGATISFEDLLGFPEKKLIPSFDAQYSFTRHSAVYAEYYAIFRDTKVEITDEFDFGEIEIPENAGELRAFVNTQIWSVGYMYSFINSRKANLSVFVNFFILGFNTGIDIDAQNISERNSFTAPLPSFGYKFNYEIAPRLRFAASHSFFFLEIGGFTGNINNLKLSLDYEATKWLRAGLSYTVFTLDLSINAPKFTGDLYYLYRGPGIYLQFIF